MLITIALWLNCTLDSFHVFAESYGKVLGDLHFSYHPSILENDLEYKKKYSSNCKQGDVSGRCIPMIVHNVTDIKTNGALFILLVESNSMLTILHSADFHIKHRCILISGSGMADLAARRFVKKISSSLELPVLALMDGDIFGFEIMVCYRYGSANSCFDSENLVKELKQMLLTNKKVDIFANTNWFVESFLPRKLQNGDWKD